MEIKKDSNLKYFLIPGYLILWIILFEFVFPVNKVLPKPSVVLLALPDLFKVYHLGLSILSSVSAVYLPTAVAWLLIFVFRRNILDSDGAFSAFFYALEFVSNFIPGILLALFLVYWFPNVEFIKYIFVFLVSFAEFFTRIKEYNRKMTSEYDDSSASLGYQDIASIRWKLSEKSLAVSFIDRHLYFWSMLLIFEYIKGGYGLGSVYRTALTYNDISGLFASIVITGIIIWLGSSILKYYSNKYLIRN